MFSLTKQGNKEIFRQKMKNLSKSNNNFSAINNSDWSELITTLKQDGDLIRAAAMAIGN